MVVGSVVFVFVVVFVVVLVVFVVAVAETGGGEGFLLARELLRRGRRTLRRRGFVVVVVGEVARGLADGGGAETVGAFLRRSFGGSIRHPSRLALFETTLGLGGDGFELLGVRLLGQLLGSLLRGATLLGGATRGELRVLRRQDGGLFLLRRFQVWF